jgi:uncharacterized repeat protein (TIGR03803 family)
VCITAQSNQCAIVGHGGCGDALTTERITQKQLPQLRDYSMTHGLLARALREVLSAPCCVAALLLLGLLTLSGCGNGSSGSPQLLALEITPTNPTVAAGTSVQLTATVIYSDNSRADVTSQVFWVTSNTAVATVGASTGKALGVAAGTATLSACLPGLSATTTLTVTSASLVSIAITPPLPSVAAGTSEQFTATGTFSNNTTQNLTADLTWTSSNTAVDTVSSSGLASAVAPGATTITATCKVASICGSLAGSDTLTVTAATLVSIAITPSAPSIALGTSETFTATGTYSDNSTQNLTSQVTWSSASPAVATVSNAAGSNGVATPVAMGTTLVTAALGGVTSTAVTLTVTSATLVSIAITPTGPSIAVAGPEQFTATGTYSDNSTQSLTSAVTWASSAASIAAISNASGSQGLATGLAVGSTSINATLGGVTSPIVTLTVTAQVESVLFSFTGTPDGREPEAGLVQDTDGNFYGTTDSGGTSGHGTVFMITPQGVEMVLYSFTGNSDGGNPIAGVILGKDGNLYGTTQVGGTNGNGTVFELAPAGVGVTPAWVETVLYSFTGGSDGGSPVAGLIQDSSGNLYGTTQWGGNRAAGVQGAGTVFELAPPGGGGTAWVETVLYAFSGGGDGLNPAAGLIQDSSGNLYGTTEYGGCCDSGVVFKLAPAGVGVTPPWVETTLYSFLNGSDGKEPVAGVTQGTDGNFYGTTELGGTDGQGTVFKVTPLGVETVVYSFTGGSDGVHPAAGLIQGTDGNFYGTTSSGGTSNNGTVFKF